MIKNIRECIIVLIFILLLPILVPFSLLKNQLEKRKRGQLASRFVCLECGSMIGVEAIRLADERWSEIVKIIMSKSDPGIRLRLVRTVDAICQHCCCQYRYRETEQTFVVREVSPEWERLGQDMDSD